MSFDHPSRERQAEPGAPDGLGDEGLEERIGDLGWNARAVIRDDDFDTPLKGSLCTRHDPYAAGRGCTDGIFIERMHQSRNQAGVRPDGELLRDDVVLELGAGIRENFSGKEEEVADRNRLCMCGLSPCEGHQIVDDPVCEPGTLLDFEEVRLAGRRILPRQIDIGRDDLERIA